MIHRALGPQGLLILGLCAACNGEGPTTTGGDAVCGDTPPTFDTLDLIDLGERTFGDETLPAIQISARVTDPDGDLSSYTADLWYDTIVDGAVEGNREVEVADTLTDEPCGVASATVGLVLPVDGDDLIAGVEYDFGLVVYDARGNPSFDGEPFVISDFVPDGTEE